MSPPAPKWQIWFRRLAWLLIIPAFPWLVRLFIFQPTSLERRYQFDFENEFSELLLQTPDSVSIHALYFPVEQPRGLVVYLHGNADNLARWGRFARDFTDLDYAVLMIEYRGYGKSEKVPFTESGLFADALAGYTWARDQFAAEDIVLYGRSLGSGLANRLAATVPARQLILETPYYSLRDMVRLYIPFGVDWLTRDYPIRSDQYFVQHHLPTTIFHGTKDRVVPYGEGKRLAALRPDADFITIPGGGHKNLNRFPQYHTELARALAREDRKPQK